MSLKKQARRETVYEAHMAQWQRGERKVKPARTNIGYLSNAVKAWRGITQ